MDLAERLDTSSYSVRALASPVKARATSELPCRLGGLPRSMAAEMAKKLLGIFHRILAPTAVSVSRSSKPGDLAEAVQDQADAVAAPRFR